MWAVPSLAEAQGGLAPRLPCAPPASTLQAFEGLSGHGVCSAPSGSGWPPAVSSSWGVPTLSRGLFAPKLEALLQSSGVGLVVCEAKSGLLVSAGWEGAERGCLSTSFCSAAPAPPIPFRKEDKA